MTPDDALPVARIGWITIDCTDPERLAAFWSGLLGVTEDFRVGTPPQYVMLHALGPTGLPLEFQRVPEPKPAKNRLHLDLPVDDLDRAASRVELLGGSAQPGPDFFEAGYRWRVMADPEGNEFCLVRQGAPVANLQREEGEARY